MKKCSSHFIFTITQMHENTRNANDTERNKTSLINARLRCKRKRHFIVKFGKDALSLARKNGSILRVHRPRKRRVRQCVAIMTILRSFWPIEPNMNGLIFQPTSKARDVQWSIRHARQIHMQRTQLARPDAMQQTEGQSKSHTSRHVLFQPFNNQSKCNIPI
jgi:hypothetical protein